MKQLINKMMMPLLRMLAVAFVGTTLTACSKDSDDDNILLPPNYIYGTWEYAGETVEGVYWGFLFRVDGIIQIWQDDHQGNYSSVAWGKFTIEDGKYISIRTPISCLHPMCIATASLS